MRFIVALLIASLFREEEGDRVQVGVQEEGSSIRKKGEKSSRLA
jgi:hypothetical protein